MDKFSYILVNLFMCLIIVSLTHCEIHRAKVNVKNAGKRTDPNYVAESDSLNEDNSTVNSNMDMTGASSVSETWLYSIVGSMLVGLSGIFPLLVIPIEAGPSLKHGAAASRLKLLLSFAVGGLLGDVFLHLLPEAWAHIKTDDDFHAAHTRIGLWVIAGMLSFLIIEKMFAKEDEFEHLEDECSEALAEEEELRCKQIKDTSNNSVTRSPENGSAKTHRKRNNKSDNKKKHSHQSKTNVVKSNGILKDQENKSAPGIKISGYLNLAANVIDNFTHGLAVAGGFLVNTKVGFITTLAILLHEIPHEVGDFAILLRSGFDRWKAAKAQLLTATGGMIGALTALLADSAQAAGEKTVWVLPFTSGGFLYIALVTVVPDLLEEKHPRESTKQIMCLLAGIAVMYLVCLVH